MTFTPSRRACSALAIAAYLIVASFAMRNTLSAPSTRLPYPGMINSRVQLVVLDHYDQSMVIATIIRNAHQLVTRPWELLADVGQCYPMPAAYTLGEHMFGVSLLAALPYALTRDPIVSYNLALVLTLWIPGVTMYFLARRFTRSAAAAFVAGLAFALVPGRLVDPSHPYVHGDLWAPAVLLFLHRLFVSARWRDALGLALFLTLEVAESLYPLISTCLVAGTYGVYLLVRHRENLPRVLPRLAVALGVASVGGWVVLAPYLETSATWGLLSGRATVLLHLGDFLPGGGYFPGFFVLALVLVALLDRLRGARLAHGEDPRLAFLAAGLVVVWSSLRHTTVPGLGIAIVSPFQLLRGLVPGLEAVRALGAVALGLHIATSFLCAYGVLASSERLRPKSWAPTAAGIACALALLSARFVPSLARAGFGHTFQYTTYDARPPQEEIDLLRAAGRGPLVDYPLGTPGEHHKRLDISESLLLASYDPRPMAACYNSFLSPVNEQVIHLADQVPATAALEALHALGFETLLLTDRRLAKAPTRTLSEALASNPEVQRRLEPLGRTHRLRTYRLQGAAPVEASYALLGPSKTQVPVQALMPSAKLDFSIANDGTSTYRHPEPLEPSDLLIQWRNSRGDLTLEEPTRGLLPVALGPGGELPVTLDARTPDVPGEYVVTLSRAAEPERPLSRLVVRLPALDSVIPPAEIVLRLNRSLIQGEILPLGFDVVEPPQDEAEMALGPGAGAASDLNSLGQVAVHWISHDGGRETMIVDADARPADNPKRVIVRLPILSRKGMHAVVLTPPGDPSTVLAGRILLVPLDAPRPRPSAAPLPAS